MVFQSVMQHAGTPSNIHPAFCFISIKHSLHTALTNSRIKTNGRRDPSSCPECTKELYPDVYEKIQAKKKKS